jgi:hypothetical protein
MIIRSDETEDLPTPDGGVMRLHIVRPVGSGRFPGVLFFSEIYQVTDPIRRLARWWLARVISSPCQKCIRGHQTISYAKRPGEHGLCRHTF